MSLSYEVAFNKLSICDLSFKNYHHMIESNYNLHKLCEKAILIKCILTLDSSNTDQLNAIETVIRTFDLSNFSDYRKSLAISTIIVLCTIITTQSSSEFVSAKVNFSSFLLVRDHSHVASTLKYRNFKTIAKLVVSWNFLLVTFRFCSISYYRQLKFNYR